MNSKRVSVLVPHDFMVPESLLSFSLEENAMMLKIGSDVLLEGRKSVIELTQKEIYQKLENEKKKQIEKMENELIVKNELYVQMEEKISKIYERQVEQLKRQMERSEETNNALREEKKRYDEKNEGIIKDAVSKERERFDLLLGEKDKQINKTYDMYQKINENIFKLSNKSASKKGDDGECNFSDFAETFIDFKGFDLIDKHTQGGQGDFHIHFEEFDVLVDAKNYKEKVPIGQINKIKNDLIKNEHIHFAWLVSLNTNIYRWDKSPIMYEWINTSQCVVYINDLTGFEDPRKILRIVWYTCKELYKLIEDINSDGTELTDLRETNFKLLEKIKKIRKTIREVNTSINVTKNLIQAMDDELREILETETTSLVTSNFSLFDDWWKVNILATNDDTTMLCTDLWMKFRQDNKKEVKELEITPDKFKKYIKSKVPISNLILKTKNPNSAFDVKGLRWNEELKNEVKKKIKEKDYYFSNELDFKILLDYEDQENDIIKLSELYSVRPWQIVSLLMKHKIISKRDQSRGYELYKETEEYKSKFIVDMT
jgi:hypothetical protein